MPSDSVSNNLHHRALSVQERVSWQREPAPVPGKIAQTKNTFTLPEDVVSLSSVRSAPPEATAGKKPSIPVNQHESKALRGNFSVYA
jgi:hypothetical protein